MRRAQSVSVFSAARPLRLPFARLADPTVGCAGAKPPPPSQDTAMAHSESNASDARDSNPDPITGAPGSHPIGTGIGAAGGGIAAGAAIGSFAGPVGTVIGAVVGAVAGGLAGKGVAEMID